MAGSAQAKPLNVGGQAVIEGVMMRSPRSFAVVCRRPGGAIVLREQRWQSIWERLKFLRWPLLRGGVVLVESLINGMSALTFSASQQEETPAAEGAAAAETAAAAQSGAAEKPAGAAKQAAGFSGVIFISILLALGLFVALPHLLTWLLGFSTDTLAFHLVDGGLKVALLVAYIGGIGLMKDIQRVYMYHGAEHKAIHTYEQGLPLSVENARAQSRFHPRCGTSFLAGVILVSVLLFAVLLRHPMVSTAVFDHLLKILIKVPLMFPVAGLSYEALRISSRFREHIVVRLLVAPGMWLQRLTTREPTDDQIEVALLALRKTLWREKATGEVQDSGVQVFASYADAMPALES